ncbi:hybrid sensor histidine kinase/response regulator transcription factor [Pedobacter endophyticus]|uniref:histidine kinase n=1 Tax=Pedobacter endophyticus TaxID=2789740 RepID=A0A7S9PZY9_9SPHI|nr:hybrid sensor histidine kinase/response regulator transcription factor [Pedobacter endophyticus]QPH40838.1 response regulator [Pedobacter endophyticus]
MMKCNRLVQVLLCLSISLAIFPAKAQLSFSNLAVENGLSQNSVIAIAQDSTGLIWLGTRQGLNRYDGHHFKTYKHDPKIAGSISNGEITSILTDTKGTIWVGTTAGLNRYNEKTDDFQLIKGLSSKGIEVVYQDRNKQIWVGTLNGLNLLTSDKSDRFKTFRFGNQPNDPANSIYAIFKAKNGEVWVGTGNGIFTINLKNGKYECRKMHFRQALPSNYVTALTADDAGNIWIGTANGLCRYHPLSGSMQVFFHDNSNPHSLIHNDIREVVANPNGQLWVGTQDGLSILNPKNLRFVNYQHDPEINNTISHNSIHSIFIDRNKNTWVGTYFGGVNMVYPVTTKFKVYRNSRFTPSISGNVISAMVEDSQHNLWIGTEGGGLNYYNRKTNSFKSYKTNSEDPNSISSNLIKMMVSEGRGSNRLIIGTHRGGLNIFDPATGRFQHVKNVKNSAGAIGSAEIVALQVDRRGTVWVGSQNGLTTLRQQNGKYPAQTTKSTLDRYLVNKTIQHLFEDSRGDLWIGTNAGLYRFNFITKQFTQFYRDETREGKLQSDYINCIAENSAGHILIGTYFGGLSIYHPKTNQFKTYTEHNGLINNNVLSVVEDEKQNLWISTANGLSELNPATGRFRNYTKSDGLAGNEFNARSYFKDSRGEIFLGGINGLTSFYPRDIQLNKYVSPLILTELKLFNQPVQVNGDDGLLRAPINDSKKLVFKHNQNHFTIEFALLNFVKPDKNKYGYFLAGYDREWNYTATPSATYTNLPAGKYRFLVKATNNDGIPGKAVSVTEVIIKPAVWATWWAYLLYFIAFSAILFLVVRFLFLRALLKRTKDIQQMKLRFFTNVSHEIRTPLTLILGPLERLLKSSHNLPEIHQQVVPIKQNADRLMRLINELMDFRKTETGNLRLYAAKQDIVNFVHEIYQSFSQLAESRNITYTFVAKVASTEIWFDKTQMEKVFFNLLSNAFKFTKNNGSIRILITEDQDVVCIEVRDNGVGIPEHSRDKLFSDFFQVESPGVAHIGSGIGLALSKSIVNAHHGNLLLKSKPETEFEAGDTCFTVVLKKGNNGLETANEKEHAAHNHSLYSPVLPPETVVNETTSAKYPNKETVLIVEDNAEIRQLLQTTLGAFYQVLESEDGKNGWEMASTHIPDLIVCDVMMPVMDGLELCKQLKNDVRTAHIPVILLTARAAHAQQVSGLETGADSYITKPFSVELLLLNVKNLLQSRANMRRKFSEQVTLQPQDVTVNTVDHKFIINAIKCIEDRMTDQDFGVYELAKEVGMSQPVLYKKIRAITDLSVNDFIKSIRLKKAAVLLESKIHNVSEVAYLVGFNDAKYFSREFKKQYGYTPKAYLTNKAKQDNVV